LSFISQLLHAVGEFDASNFDDEEEVAGKHSPTSIHSAPDLTFIDQHLLKQRQTTGALRCSARLLVLLVSEQVQ